MPIPANYLPLGIAGLKPDGTDGAEFFITKEDIAKIKKVGPPWKFDDVRIFPEVLASPHAIFEGLKRADYEDGFCYSIKPSCCWNGRKKIDPPADWVFLVFIRTEKGYLVFDWEWRPRHPKDEGHPEKWEKDFGRKSWPKP